MSYSVIHNEYTIHDKRKTETYINGRGSDAWSAKGWYSTLLCTSCSNGVVVSAICGLLLFGRTLFVASGLFWRSEGVTVPLRLASRLFSVAEYIPEG